MLSWPSLAFSVLFVEQVVAIWSVVTEDTYTGSLTTPPELGPDPSFLTSQQKQCVFVKYEEFSQACGLERNKGKRGKTLLSLRFFLS